MLITPTIRPLAPFAYLAGRTVTTRPSRALRRRMRTPEALTVSQWAERYRRVTEIDAKPGKWRGEMVPHAGPIMDDIGKPWVRQVWICLPERGAKTQVLLNTVCWGIDQGSQAGNIFWLMPTEHDARKAMGERVIPVFRAKDDHGRPGRIARYLSGAADDTSRGAIRFNHGIRLFPAWANSPGSMASYFGRINIADECDKFPERTSEGSDPITLFLKRARDDRHRSKYVFASTPAGRFIHKGAMACVQIKTWAMRCPDCGELVTPTEEHLHIPQETTLESVASAELGLTCPACGTIWGEEARATAYRGGRELIVKGADNPRPESIGWQVPAWVFPVIPLVEIASAKLRAATGDHAVKVAWANGYLVEDYKQETKERAEEAILRLRDERPAGMVPAEADGLTLIADTQDKGFWYEVRAWRYGLDLKSWLVRAGFVPSAGPRDFSALDGIRLGEYPDAEGRVHRIGLVAIDTGGHRTSECYDWCRATGALATKGATNRKTRPVSVNRLDVYPDGRTMLGGLNLYSLDTHYHKDALVGKLKIDPSDPGAWVLHSGYTATQLEAVARGEKLAHNLDDYAKQFCVEYRDERGLWQCPPGKDNHLFDCAQMGLALVMFLGWQHLSRDIEEETASEATVSGGFVNRWR
jgi:phage terminase large subunit GpA-like protein